MLSMHRPVVLRASYGCCCLKHLLQQQQGALWGKWIWLCSIHGSGVFSSSCEVAPQKKTVLEDMSQEPAQQKALGDLGVKTGRDVLGDQA